MDRTEEQIVAQANITVILGGKTYEVAPLVIRDSRPWRQKVIKLISPVSALSKTSTDTPEDFEQALTILLVDMPDQVLDLFFEYAKELDREDIESKATDAEMAVAFKAVMEVAFPLAQSVPDTMKRIYGVGEKTTKKGSR